MRNLTTNEMTTVNGGACHYDAATERALESLYRQAASLGLAGSSTVQQAADQIKANGTLICN